MNRTSLLATTMIIRQYDVCLAYHAISFGCNNEASLENQLWRAHCSRITLSCGHQRQIQQNQLVRRRLSRFVISAPTPAAKWPYKQDAYWERIRSFCKFRCKIHSIIVYSKDSLVRKQSCIGGLEDEVHGYFLSTVQRNSKQPKSCEQCPFFRFCNLLVLFSIGRIFPILQVLLFYFIFAASSYNALRLTLQQNTTPCLVYSSL